MEEHTIPKHTSVSRLPQELVAIFELMSEGNEYDPALINTIGREAVSALQQEGYNAKPPAYTGQKGIESFFVELVFVAQSIATFVESNHVAIAESIADISGLITVLGGILPMFQRMHEVHERNVGKTESTTHPIKMILEIDEEPLVIEVFDINQADAALKLALKYRSTHLTKASQVTTKSKIKVKGYIPARERRRRK